MTASNLLINALSKSENKFVVAIITISLFRSVNLSNSLRIVDVTRPISLTSFEFILFNAITSISSNNTTTLSGCGSIFISLNTIEIFLFVCPNLLSIKFSKLTQNNVLSIKRATCFTASVLPVPGNPSKRNLFIPIL